ncbi:Uncharacterised protein [Vibrio cholerae]|nr:Uncharacterised protein [Vibrio cholerae]
MTNPDTATHLRTLLTHKIRKMCLRQGIKTFGDFT